MRIPLIILILSLTVACKNDKFDQKKIEFKLVDHQIPIDQNFLSSYPLYRITLHQDIQILVGYNHTSHSFDLFDLTHNKVFGQIKLQSEGPNGVVSVGNFAVNNDQIIVTSGGSMLTILDYNGHIISKKSLSDLIHRQDLFFTPPGLMLGNYSEFYLNDSIMLCPLFDQKKKEDKKYFEQIYFLMYNTNSQAASIAQFNFPKPERFYGALDYPFVIPVDNELYISIPFSSSIYIADLNTKSITESKVEIKNANSVAKPISLSSHQNFAKRYEHFINSNRFFNLHHFNDEKLFVRTYKGETNYNRSNPDQTDNLYDNNYLIVIDERFGSILDLKIPNKLSPTFQVTQTGLLFLYNQRSIEDESTLKYQLFVRK